VGIRGIAELVILGGILVLVSSVDDHSDVLLD